MKRIIINLAVMLALSVSGVYAHGPEGEGHAPKPEITENQARAKATQSVAVIVKDASSMPRGPS